MLQQTAILPAPPVLLTPAEILTIFLPRLDALTSDRFQLGERFNRAMPRHPDEAEAILDEARRVQVLINQIESTVELAQQAYTHETGKLFLG